MKGTGMNADHEIELSLPAWRWCSRCNCAFEFGRASRLTYNPDLTACPSCGAGVEHWRLWDDLHSRNPSTPVTPVEGAMYLLYPSAAEKKPERRKEGQAYRAAKTRQHRVGRR